jgi:hypothetical protein
MSIGGTVFAQVSTDGGCKNCNKGAQIDQSNSSGTAAGETDLNLQFRKDTLDLRQEMMNKRFELQRENLKGAPDVARIAVLKADISAIQSRINSIRVRSGLPDKGKRDGECYKKGEGCNKQNELDGCIGKPCQQK